MSFEMSKLFLAFIVLINPFGVLAIFLDLTQNYTKRERRRVAQIASAGVFILICVFTLLGSLILKAFGISIGSFQVGGGILVFLIAVSMVNGGKNSAKPDIGTSEDNEITIKQPPRADLASIAVVPIAMPMMVGPGAISTIIIHTSAARSPYDMLLIIAVGAVISVICYLGLLAADKISKLLGQSGLTIFNRIMGMMLAAVAVEIILAGLRSLFPQLSA